MTFAAPAASASAMSRGCRTPPSAHTCLPRSRAASAHSSTAENCGRPTPVIIRVVHMAPGPTPTFTTSAPASIRSRVPAAVTTFPATTGADPATDRTARTASIGLLLVAVRGVHHQDVDPGGQQGAGLALDVPVDPDRGRREQEAVLVDGGRVERRPQRALAGDHADQALALDDRRRADPGLGEDVEDLRQVGARRDGQRIARHDLRELGEAVDVLAGAVGDHADRHAVLDHDDDAVRPLVQEGQRLTDGGRRARA